MAKKTYKAQSAREITQRFREGKEITRTTAMFCAIKIKVISIFHYMWIVIGFDGKKHIKTTIVRKHEPTGGRKKVAQQNGADPLGKAGTQAKLDEMKMYDMKLKHYPWKIITKWNQGFWTQYIKITWNSVMLWVRSKLSTKSKLFTGFRFTYKGSKTLKRKYVHRSMSNGRMRKDMGVGKNLFSKKIDQGKYLKLMGKTVGLISKLAANNSQKMDEIMVH